MGIEDPDHNSSGDHDASNLTSSQNDENLITSSSSDIDLLDPNWVPISSSSITLNRKEAYGAIMELQCRDKLLIRRMKKKAAAKQDETDLTPLIDNAKTISKQQQQQNDAAPETTKVTKKSLTAPSSWFQSTKNAGGTITSITEKSSSSNNNNNKSTPSRPPRGSSSISPSSFSTFSNFITPPRKAASAAKNNEENSNNDDGEDDTIVTSPPHNTDASTASSLLWEDRTLTSVSEEDAAAFRKKGKTKHNIIDHRHNHHNHNQATTSASSPVERKDSLTRHDSSDEDDWDGFDHVVLLVTIFSTHGLEEQSGNKNISSGDVVVMELMSTNDPPLPQTHGDNDVVAASDVTPTSRSKQQQQQQQQRRRSSSLKVSTSSSSSLTTPSPPSLSQRSKAGGGGGGSVTVESCSDSTVNMQHQQHPITDGEVETPSNHSRLLARRELRWPTSVVSRITANSNKGDGCPAFVALGRTTVINDESPNSSNQREGYDHRKVKLNPKLHGKIKSVRGDERKKDSTTKSSSKVMTHDEEDDRIADAMDAIRSLNFLFEGERTSTVGETTDTTLSSSSSQQEPIKSNSDDKEVQDTGNKIKKKQPLSLCFVTNDGYAHFFHAIRLFLSRRTSSSSSSSGGDELSNSFAAFVMGSKLYTKVRQDVAPLSRPQATVKLSQVTGLKELGDSTLIWKDVVSNDSESSSGYTEDSGKEINKKATRSNWANLTSFDASIDPETVPLRTLRRTNILSGSCFTSDTNNSYLAVCGKGLRRYFVRGRKTHSLGGFVTFISLRHHAESKTIYLPFAPHNIHPAYWGRKHFVIISGEEGIFEDDQSGNVSHRRPCAVAVRVDSTQQGGFVDVKRFQPVPIKLPSISESLGFLAHALSGEETSLYSEIIGVSSIPSSPPGIIISFQRLSSNASAVVVNHTLTVEDSVFVFGTTVRDGHRVLMDDDTDCKILSDEVTDRNTMRQSELWCTGGQGWSLLGRPNASSYFVCWDGSTEADGPFVLQFERIKSNTCLVSGVMPLIDRSAQSNCYEEQATVFNKPPTPPSFRLEENDDFLPKLACSLTIKESIKLTAAIEGGIDDILVRALGSISNESERRSSRSKKLMLSHNEKSRRLLRHCSSWTQLQNRGTAYGQVLFAFVRSDTQLQSLSLRSNAIYSPLSTPFNQVLSWLCQRRDYFTAASVALSLIDDPDAVYELRGIQKTGDNDKQYLHKGLIDSITPLDSDGGSHETMTSLADMAVGCLIKGGAEMSSALEGFLLRNNLYDASDACLMLVGTATVALSQDTIVDQKMMDGQNIVTMISSVERPKAEVTWPVRCLLKMAVVRNCLRSVMLMLNASIPNELRWRAPKSKGAVPTKRPSLGIFLELVDIILESSPEATRVLLDLLDEETGMPFWFSIEEDTRLALSLASIHGKYVMLQEPEVRSWALERLKKEIELPSEYKYHHVNSHLPDEWLREVVTGTFCNAETEIGMGLDMSNLSTSNDESSCYREDMKHIEEMLVPKNRAGLDFDLLIAALLILSHRQKEWREGAVLIRTQVLLNAVCEMAGKKMESKFMFDSANVLRQCGLIGNIKAAAFLVGGKNGLILECVDLMTSQMDIEIKDAETALFAASVNELKEMMSDVHKNLDDIEESHFSPCDGHRHLLWLLEEHVLSVVKYGEFNSLQNTEKVDPVFVGRLCFRAWYSLTRPSDLRQSVKWLESWLRSKLNLSNGTSSKRLACAALVRVLLWIDEDGELDLGDSEEDSILAALLGFDSRFMAELAQACCGLIESIPPHLADEQVMCSMNHFAFEASGPLLNAS